MTRVTLVSLWFVLVIGSSTNARANYQLVDLGELGVTSDATSIDRQGRVAGFFKPTFALGAQAFLWDSAIIDLSLSLPISNISSSSAVGSSGNIIIGSLVSSDLSPAGPHGFCLTKSTTGYTFSFLMFGLNNARAINDGGVIVGQANLNSHTRRGYIKDNCQSFPDEIGKVPTLYRYDTTDPRGINNHSEVVGTTRGTNKPPRAFYFTRNGGSVALDLPTTTVHSHAYAINDNHDIVGHAKGIYSNTEWVPVIWSRVPIVYNPNPFDRWWKTRLAPPYHRVPKVTIGYNYEPRVMSMLPGANYAKAFGMNNHGEFVGTVGMPSGQRAFIHDRGRMIDLNDVTTLPSGWILLQANDISDHGRIAGQGMLNGVRRAFMLIPQ